MWGDGFLSPGGPEEVECLLSGVEFEGRTVVDIGSGAGGVPILLADRYGAARVIGLDVEATMVAHARAKVERAGLQDRIEIRRVEPGPMPLPDASIDVVFSKDSSVHILDWRIRQRPHQYLPNNPEDQRHLPNGLALSGIPLDTSDTFDRTYEP